MVLNFLKTNLSFKFNVFGWSATNLQPKNSFEFCGHRFHLVSVVHLFTCVFYLHQRFCSSSSSKASGPEIIRMTPKGSASWGSVACFWWGTPGVTCAYVHHDHVLWQATTPGAVGKRILSIGTSLPEVTSRREIHEDNRFSGSQPRVWRSGKWDSIPHCGNKPKKWLALTCGRGTSLWPSKIHLLIRQEPVCAEVNTGRSLFCGQWQLV